MQKIVKHVTILLMLIVLVGCSPNAESPTEVEQEISPEVISNLCVGSIEEMELEPFDVYGLFKCDNGLKLDLNLLDAPSLVYNEDGTFIAYCGGAPGPAGDTGLDPDCPLECDQQNLCES